LFGCSPNRDISSDTATPSPTPDRRNEIVVPNIPKTTWEPIFFDAINESDAYAGFDKLRDSKLGDDDLEIRVWAGFGKSQLKGFVLRRIDSKWSAYRIGPENGKDFRKPGRFELGEPAIGWERAWSSLEDHKILSLPDARAIKCENRFLDGYSYVVEVKKGQNYRTYMYDNPDVKSENKCAEGDEILAIAEIITNDYQVPGFKGL
jgi:hypothetical protein